MAKYSVNQVAAFAKGAGFTGDNLVIAVAVAMAESSGNADIVNSKGCVGLWQIRQRAHVAAHPTWSVAWLQHPGNNASAARILYGQYGWRPWSAYANGSYKTYISLARRAVNWVNGVKTKSGSITQLGATAGHALSKAASYIGYVERGNNRTQFWDRQAPSLNGQRWCAAFTYDVLKSIGIDMKRLGFGNPFYCPSLVQVAKAKGMWSSVPTPGSLAIFTWNGRTPQHVGFVEKVLDKEIQTIEGNTSRSGSGSQNNGGGVWRKRRKRSVILGYIRIPYDAQDGVTGLTGAPGTVMDNAEQRTPQGAIKVNGNWNAATVVDLKLASRMPSSADTTAKFWRHIEVWTGLTGKWVDADLDYVTIEALQWKTKQAITGRWDKNTIMGIQKYLNDLRAKGLLNEGIAPGPVPDGP